ncbi:hypothetical protein D3C75_503280 [compost metagenome]
MGQGTESCGGYEVDFDEYEECGVDGYWIQRNGSKIKIEDMTVSHMRNCQRICRQLAACATFTSDEEKWNEWVQVFDNEIARRPPVPLKAVTAPKAPQRGSMVVMICHCKQEYKAREAELKRGNGYSCSKRCAAIRREFGRPKATRKPL